ncbi:hypothetical protein ACFX2I_006204 [Malus domestica]
MLFWVFGYGSLVWNPGFEYDKKVRGYIKDYTRLFDLACIDHGEVAAVGAIVGGDGVQGVEGDEEEVVEGGRDA